MTNKGFGLKKSPQIEYQVYNAELKRRYLSDGSEIMLGSASIKVPKTLYDLSGQTLTKREVWDAFAKAVVYCILCSEPAEQKGVNQIFLFDNRWNLLERCETNSWDENGNTPTYQEPMDEDTANITWEAFQRCQVEVDWLDIPVVA